MQRFVSKIVVSVLPASAVKRVGGGEKIQTIRTNLEQNINNFITNLASQIRLDKTGVDRAGLYLPGLLVVMQLEDTFNDFQHPPLARLCADSQILLP